MARTYQKVFNDKRRLNTMFEMRRQGFSLLSLALIFGVDHSSIHHLCKKYNVSKSPQELEFSLKHIISLNKVFVRVPKSYAEYLRDDEIRRGVSQLNLS